jgi:phosphonate transport system permease protein
MSSTPNSEGEVENPVSIRSENQESEAVNSVSGGSVIENRNRILRGLSFLRKRPAIIINIVLVSLAFTAAKHLKINSSSLGSAWRNLKIISSEAFPPDWRVITERAGWTSPQCTFETDWLCSPAVHGLLQTLEIAFLATLFGAIIALPLATLAATNLAPPILAQSVRQLLAALRVLPSLVWALIFVILVGIGPLAGVLAMTMYTVGYLGKLQYEALEGISKEPIEAARTMGLPRWQIARFFAIPEAANALLSQTLFMFEYNVRHGSVIGLVGAGGIGLYLTFYLSPFSLYDRVLALIIVMFVAVIIIDQCSLAIRRRFMDDEPHRASWLSIIFPWTNR